MKLSIEPEVGITENSLRNAEILQKKFGKPWRISLVEPDTLTKGDQFVMAAYAGHIHLFTGFSWGYGGTGPHGLLTFLLRLGVKISMQEIIQLSTDQLEIVINKEFR